MLDAKYVRDHLDEVRAAMESRCESWDVNAFCGAR